MKTDEKSNQQCEACRAGAPAAGEEERAGFLSAHPGWTIETVEGVPRLTKEFRFPDFAGAMRFAARVGEAADAENHHPAILVEWGRVRVQWWTHKIGGLHRNDLIMADRTDRLASVS
jgi:4a-hydroxytetrahydrobiopterin dehydratase